MTRTQQLIAGGAALVVALGGLVFLLTRGGETVAATPATTDAPTATDAPTTTTGAPDDPVYALTGLPVDDPAMAARPTLIVKIDNADAAARPQSGVNEADVVYEEQVEGGVTRFAAVFQSRDGVVGPVRSARSTDIAIGTAFGQPLFAFSGANNTFMDLIRGSALVELPYDWRPELYERVADRPPPDNIFTPTATLYAADPGDATAPPAKVFTFRAPGESLPDSALPTRGIRYHFGGAGVETIFTWNAELGGWRREQNGTAHIDVAVNPIAPENVILQTVDYIDTGVRDVAGSPVPEAQMLGEGEVLVLTDGHAIAGRWSRPSIDDVTTYTDADGDPIALTPGQTWISLLAPGIAELLP